MPLFRKILPSNVENSANYRPFFEVIVDKSQKNSKKKKVKKEKNMCNHVFLLFYFSESFESVIDSIFGQSAKHTA